MRLFPRRVPIFSNELKPTIKPTATTASHACCCSTDSTKYFCTCVMFAVDLLVSELKSNKIQSKQREIYKSKIHYRNRRENGNGKTQNTPEIDCPCFCVFIHMVESCARETERKKQIDRGREKKKSLAYASAVEAALVNAGFWLSNFFTTSIRRACARVMHIKTEHQNRI